MAALGLLCLAGCGKANYETDLVIRPRIRRVDSSPAGGEAAYQMRVYAWYIGEGEKVDTWKAESWEDADAGIITNIKTGEKRSFEFMQEQPEIELGEGEVLDDEQTYLHFYLTRSPIFLVAVDPLNKFYAYRMLETPKPMPVQRVTLMLQLWRKEVSYKFLEWTIVNATKEKEQEEQTELTIKPRVQEKESDPQAGTPAFGVKSFAWYLSEEEAQEGDWKPASWEDAQAGIITDTGTGDRRDAGVAGEQPDKEEPAETDSYIKMVVDKPYVVVAAVDMKNGFYAWRTIEKPSFTPEMELSVTFRLWKTGVYDEEEWTVAKAPDEP